MSMSKKGNGLESVPGDRGDSTQAAGVAKLKSGYAGNLKTELIKGYDPAPTQGWAANVKR